VRFHARGGLGEVHVAEDAELHRSVALKRMQAQYADDPESIRRFLLEAEITGRLEHPGVVPVYGLLPDADGQPCYAMRFIEGESLKEALERFHAAGGPAPGERRLDFRQLLQRFVAVCNTVAYAHSRGIIHRDLKPGNIMLGRFGETLVVDWGLAKSVARTEAERASGETTLTPTSGDSSTGTEMGRALGTPAYMSPEQAVGRWEAVGPASDIYSLGATLYHLLTGRPPFAKSVAKDLLAQVVEGDFRPPRQVQPEVPPALEAICLKAMAREPEGRYATALELAADVEHWLADEPVTVYREPALVRLGRWGRRHRSLVVGAAVLLITAVLALMASTILITREKQIAEDNYRDAEEQRARADRNLQKALQAVDRMLARVGDRRLRSSPHMDQLRRELLEEALNFNRAFLAEEAKQPSVRWEAARAYFRIAKLQEQLGWRGAEVSYRQALELFEQLAADAPDVPAYRQELAGTYHNLGNVMRAAKRLAPAEIVYRKGLRLREELAAAYPQDPDYQRDVSASQHNVGTVLADQGKQAEAEAAFRESLRLRQRLADAFPGQADDRAALAGTWNNLAVLLAKTNRPREAEEARAQALALRERLAADFPDDPDHRHSLAASYHNVGHAHRTARRFPEADQMYQKAQALWEQLACDFPDRPEYRQRLAQVYNNRGMLLMTLNRPADAESALRQALALREQLVRDFPKNPDYHEELATVCNNLGNLLEQGSRHQQAEPVYRQALEEFTRLAAEFPSREHELDLATAHYSLGTFGMRAGWPAATIENHFRQGWAVQKKLAEANPRVPEYQLEWAKGCNNLGVLLRDSRRTEEAEQLFSQALILLEKLAAVPSGDPAVRVELGNVQNNRAILLNRAGRPTEADVAYRQALAVRQDLATKFPQVADFQADLGAVLHNWSGLLADQGRLAEASQRAQQARVALQEALQLNPDQPTYRRSLGSCLLQIGQVALRRNEHAPAAQAAEEVARQFPRDARALYNAACILARCLPLAGQDAKLPEAQRPPAVQAYAERALALLRQAVAQGFKDVAHLKEDHDLDALRQRQEFQKLLAELERR
jgi:serine/threonine-protein kinase